MILKTIRSLLATRVEKPLCTTRLEEAKTRRYMKICKLVQAYSMASTSTDRKYSLTVKDVTCSICDKPFVHPITLRCGHSFCRICMAQWIVYSKTCPDCKIKQREYDLFQHKENTLLTRLTASVVQPESYNYYERIDQDERYNVDWWMYCKMTLEFDEMQDKQDLWIALTKRDDRNECTYCLPSPLKCAMLLAGFLVYLGIFYVGLIYAGKDYKSFLANPSQRVKVKFGPYLYTDYFSDLFHYVVYTMETWIGGLAWTIIYSSLSSLEVPFVIYWSLSPTLLLKLAQVIYRHGCRMEWWEREVVYGAMSICVLAFLSQIRCCLSPGPGLKLLSLLTAARSG